MKKQKFLTLSKDSIDRVAYNLHEYQVIPETREIFLHRHIHSESGDDGDGCGIDYRAATRFIKNLTLLNNQGHDNIFVHMESRGGDWADGMAIYDAIKASESPVIILAYAHARSMTSIIIQAATVRVMMPSAIFLILLPTIGYALYSHGQSKTRKIWILCSVSMQGDARNQRYGNGRE